MGKENYIRFMKTVSKDAYFARKAVNIRVEAEKTGKTPQEYTEEFRRLVKEIGLNVSEDELDEIIFYSESIGLSDEELDMAAGGVGLFAEGETCP